MDCEKYKKYGGNMKVIENNGSFNIYNGEKIKTHDYLPSGIYEVCFSKMTGFWLERDEELEITEDKVYGIHEKKIDKVLGSFKLFNRNMGVILSGDKGIGKSLFAKMLCIKGNEEYDYPIILVNKYIPGISNFIDSIQQECIVLFDEFDKTFAGNDEYKPQNEMLPLFDGLSNGKKLFIITCNYLHKIDKCLLNRPGRFHYHFRFEYPNAEEIREYLEDKLRKEYYDQIDEVVRFTYTTALNYDCLRAIAFELNQGESFKDAINDLNIINYNLEPERCYIELCYKNGDKFIRNGHRLDLSSSNSDFMYLVKEDKTYHDEIGIYIYPNTVQLNYNTLNMYIDPIDIVIDREEIEIDEDNDESTERHDKLFDYYINKNNIQHVIIKKLEKDNYRFAI